MMNYDDYWRIGGVVIDLHSGPEKKLAPSSGYDLQCVTTGQSDPPDNNPDAWRPAHARHDELLRYGNVPEDSVVIHETGGTRRPFTETHGAPTALPNRTLLAALEPPAGTALRRGCWALVTSVEDGTTNPDVPVATLSIVVVAPLEAYLDSSRAPNYAAAQRNLAIGGI